MLIQIQSLNLIQNAMKTNEIIQLKEEPEMELLHYTNSPAVFLRHISGLTRAIAEVKIEQKELVPNYELH